MGFRKFFQGGVRGDKEQERPKFSAVNWKRLLRYLKPYRGRLLLAVVALMISSGLSLVFPVVIRDLIDSVLVNADLALLNRVTLLLLVVFLIRSITSLIHGYTINQVGESVTRDIKLSLYQHLLKLSLDFYAHTRVGELISRISSDATVLRTALTSNLGTLFQQSFILIGSIVLMLVINWRLSLFILALAPIAGLLGALFGLYLRRASQKVQDELAGSTVIAEEVLQNIRVVKSFVREPFENRRFRDAIDDAYKAAIGLLRIRSLFGPLMGFLVFGSLALILWFGGREVLDGRLTGGELIAFLIYGLTVAGGVGSIVGLYTSLQEALGASQRVFELLDREPQIQPLDQARDLGDIDGRIQLQGVSFSYEEDQPVLQNVDLDISSGEILALVGPSGAGKTTIFNLIPRFYDPSSGKILLDGYDLRELTPDTLRAQIGIVPQETLLFGGTIAENIRYGKINADPEEIVAAAKAANAHQFIQDLPDQYETVVGERGVRLSGGQRQRVSIARALLKDPCILLLDEATSSLDSESEELVQEALERLLQGRTTVIIAHRLSTVRIAHRIAVLDAGEIVELGTHKELLALDGRYARYYHMQFRDQAWLPGPGMELK
jgi:ATP-binding cassette, subfamily B, bacterial MsbA